MLLPLIHITFARSVAKMFGKFLVELQERQLARTVDHGSQLNVELATIYDFQNDRSVPSRLNPWCRLMHAETDACISSAAFDESDKVQGDAHALVSHSEHKLMGLEKKRVALTHRVFL